MATVAGGGGGRRKTDQELLPKIKPKKTQVNLLRWRVTAKITKLEIVIDCHSLA